MEKSISSKKILLIFITIVMVIAFAAPGPVHMTARAAGQVTLERAIETPNSDWIFWDDYETETTSGANRKYWQYDGPTSFLRTSGTGLTGSTGMKVDYPQGSGGTAGVLGALVGNVQGGPSTNIAGGAGTTLNDIYFRFYVKADDNYTSVNGLMLAQIVSYSGWNRQIITDLKEYAGGTVQLSVTSYFDAATGEYNASSGRAAAVLTSSSALFDNANRGEWQCVEIRLKNNSAGSIDGIAELWINGVKEDSRENVNLIGEQENLSVTKRGFNHVALHNYIGGNMVPQMQSRVFDNLVVSKSYIGPVTHESFIVGDKTALTAAITAAIGLDRANPVYALSEADFTPSSWAAYKAAIAAAIAVEENIYADQDEVDKALTALYAATPAALSADLSSLRQNVGKRTPDAFDPAVLFYTIDVEDDAELFKLIAETADPGSIIRVGTASYHSGDEIPVALTTRGETTTVNLEVVSSIGDTKTYVITINYAKPYRVKENPTQDWIFWDDFDEDRMSSYYTITNPNTFNRRLEKGYGMNDGVMRADWLKGSNSAGLLQLAIGRTPDNEYFKPAGDPTKDYKEIYYRYYVKMPRGWKYGGLNKMSRIYALQDNDYTDPKNPIVWPQSMIAHTWNDHYVDPKDETKNDKWINLSPASGIDITGGNASSISGRPELQTNGKLITTTYNDFENLSWTGTGWVGVNQSKMPVFDEDHNGEWYAVECHIKLNDPGQNNGVFELWIDDEWQAGYSNVNFTGTYEGYGMNMINLENWFGRGAQDNCVRYFDNLVVSTSKIGLASKLYEGSVNKTALTSAITVEIGGDHDNPVYKLIETEYTAESWAAYRAAVAKAIAVEKDIYAGQAEISAAMQNLAAAKAKLAANAIRITGVSNGNGQSNVDFPIRSANGKGYSVYISETGGIDSFELYANVNYNSKGAHIKGLTNGKTYYVYIAYSDGKIVERSAIRELHPGK